MPLTPPANSTGFHHHFPPASNNVNNPVMHVSMNAANTAAAGAPGSSATLMAPPSYGVAATPLQMQLLYGTVGQYDCGSRTRASLAQAADGSLDETLSREMEMERLSLEDGSSSVS